MYLSEYQKESLSLHEVLVSLIVDIVNQGKVLSDIGFRV
jgi:hypothetical protein